MRRARLRLSCRAASGIGRHAHRNDACPFARRVEDRQQAKRHRCRRCAEDRCAPSSTAAAATGSRCARALPAPGTVSASRAAAKPARPRSGSRSPPGGNGRLTSPVHHSRKAIVSATSNGPFPLAAAACRQCRARRRASMSERAWPRSRCGRARQKRGSPRRRSPGCTSPAGRQLVPRTPADRRLRRRRQRRPR